VRAYQALTPVYSQMMWKSAPLIKTAGSVDANLDTIKNRMAKRRPTINASSASVFGDFILTVARDKSSAAQNRLGVFH
jgi:hypothetical protein